MKAILTDLLAIIGVVLNGLPQGLLALCELPVFFRLNRESLYLCFKIILFFRLFSI